MAERIGLRVPGVVPLVTRAIYRLLPHFRLRQAVVRRAAEWATEAVNRGDYEAAFVLHDPGVEFNPPAEMVGLGEEAVTRGRQERVRFQRTWTAQWGEVRFEPEECIDLGDRLLAVGRMKGSGLGSGATFDHEWANLVTISAGRVIREQVFRDHEEALNAAGLSE